MKFDLPFPEIYPVIRRAIQPTTKVYLVGGCVRDLLLDREPQDIDLVLTSEVRKVSRLLANHFHGAVYALDDERETMRVIVDYEGKSWKLDIALLRGEELAEDLYTRDFTVNAMAIDVSGEVSGKVIDYFDAQKDLHDRKLRICSESSIEDDPIRILRGVRLGLTLGFAVDQITHSKMRSAAQRLDEISAERKRDELFKLLSLHESSKGLKELYSLDVLPILLPNSFSANLINESALSDLIVKIESNEPNFFTSSKCQLQDYLNTALVEERSILSLLKIASIVMSSPNFSKAIDDLASSFALSNRETIFLEQAVNGQRDLMAIYSAGSSLDAIRIYHFFKLTANAGVASCLLALVEDSLSRESDKDALVRNMVDSLIDVYFHEHEKYLDIQPILDGNDLIKLFKLKPGPRFKELLELLKEAQVSGKVTTKVSAQHFIQELLDQNT